MGQHLTRRGLLRASLVSATAVGAGLAVGAASASAGERHPGPPEIPDVPGMHGDPFNNEFWYQYDEAFLYHPSVTVKAALTAITEELGSVQAAFALAWQEHRANGTFPDGFVAEFLPVKEPLTVVADAQFDVMHRFFRPERREAAVGVRRLRPGRALRSAPLSRPARTHDGLPGRHRAAGRLPRLALHHPGPDPVGHRPEAVERRRPPRRSRLGGAIHREAGHRCHRQPAAAAGCARPADRRVVRRSPEEMDTEFDNFPYPTGVS